MSRDKFEVRCTEKYMKISSGGISVNIPCEDAEELMGKMRAAYNEVFGVKGKKKKTAEPDADSLRLHQENKNAENALLRAKNLLAGTERCRSLLNDEKKFQLLLRDADELERENNFYKEIQFEQYIKLFGKIAKNLAVFAGCRTEDDYQGLRAYLRNSQSDIKNYMESDGTFLDDLREIAVGDKGIPLFDDGETRTEYAVCAADKLDKYNGLIEELDAFSKSRNMKKPSEILAEWQNLKPRAEELERFIADESERCPGAEELADNIKKYTGICKQQEAFAETNRMNIWFYILLEKLRPIIYEINGSEQTDAPMCTHICSRLYEVIEQFNSCGYGVSFRFISADDDEYASYEMIRIDFVSGGIRFPGLYIQGRNGRLECIIHGSV